MEQYSKIRILGEGGFGKVWLAVDNKTDNLVALKELYRIDDDSVKRFKKEIKILEALKGHPNVVQIYDYSTESNPPYIVMEFLPDGSLDTRMNRITAPVFALFVVRKIAEVLHILHQNGGFHRDIKPSNIMVDRIDRIKWSIKLADFGLGQLPTSSSSVTFSAAGTYGYVAPELIASPQYPFSTKCDIYSLGITLIQMLTCSIQKDSLHNPMLSVPQKIKSLATAMTDAYPQQRPSAEEVMSIIDDIYKDIKTKQRPSQPRKNRKADLAGIILGGGLLALGFAGLANLLSEDEK